MNRKRDQLSSRREYWNRGNCRISEVSSDLQLPKASFSKFPGNKHRGNSSAKSSLPVKYKEPIFQKIPSKLFHTDLKIVMDHMNI